MDINQFIVNVDGKTFMDKQCVRDLFVENGGKKNSLFLDVLDNYKTENDGLFEIEELYAFFWHASSLLPEHITAEDQCLLLASMAVQETKPMYNKELIMEKLTHAVKNVDMIKAVVPSPLLDEIKVDLGCIMVEMTKDDADKNGEPSVMEKVPEQSSGSKKEKDKKLLDKYYNKVREDRKYLPAYSQEEKAFLTRCGAIAKAVYNKTGVSTTVLYRKVYTKMTDIYGIVLDQLEKDVKEAKNIDKDATMSRLSTLAFCEKERQIFENLLKDTAEELRHGILQECMLTA